jgi:hypothetical protein
MMRRLPVPAGFGAAGGEGEDEAAQDQRAHNIPLFPHQRSAEN